MPEQLTKDIKKNILKDIIKRLHEGEPLTEIKAQFKNILSHITTTEITELEEELISEGLKREELIKLCDIHTELFKEAIEGQQTLAPMGHPIFILIQEHKLMLDIAEQLKGLSLKFLNSDGKDTAVFSQIEQLVEHLKSSECHYLREENVLFPYLEKHGITEPPKIMWMEHDNIREIKKLIYLDLHSLKESFSKDISVSLHKNGSQLLNQLSSHFYKENNILFSVAMRLIEEGEWYEIYKEFVEIGFSDFYTPPFWKDFILRHKTTIDRIEEKEIQFDTGQFTFEELESLINTLPFDITYVDKDDVVKFFTDSKDRIFVRTKAVLGRTVQHCHPAKSIHLVNKILQNFKSKESDNATFWINLGGRLILIQYFAVRNKNGKYLGCLEVTKDITEIKKIEGEKRLL